MAQEDIASVPYQNPELKERNLVPDVALVKKLKRTVPQTELRRNPKLRRMKLSNSSAPIAVSPLTAAEYKAPRLASR